MCPQHSSRNNRIARKNNKHHHKNHGTSVTLQTQRGNKTTKLHYEESKVHRPAKPLMITFLCDTSASMDNLISGVCDWIQYMFSDVLRIYDRFNYVTFSKTAKKKLSPKLKQHIDVQRVVDDLYSEVRKGTLTAMYDAIVSSVSQYERGKKYDKCHKELFVLTDGLDNVSRHTSSEARQAIAQAKSMGIHVSIIAMGMDKATVDHLKRELAPNSFFHNPRADKATILRVLKKYTSAVQKRWCIRMETNDPRAMQELGSMFQNCSLNSRMLRHLV